MSGKFLVGNVSDFLRSEAAKPYEPELDDLAISVADGTRARGRLFSGYDHHTDTVYLYAAMDAGDGEELWLSIESYIPDGHDIEHQRDIDGDDAILGLSCETSQWMLENGIAPGQVFLMTWSICYSKFWTDSGWEYDSEVSIAIIWVEPWSPERSAEAWQLWLDAAS
jgi:hypothetical protein